MYTVLRRSSLVPQKYDSAVYDGLLLSLTVIRLAYRGSSKRSLGTRSSKRISSCSSSWYNFSDRYEMPDTGLDPDLDVCCLQGSASDCGFALLTSPVVLSFRWPCSCR